MKKVLILCLAAATLALPAAGLADNGGGAPSQPTPSATRGGQGDGGAAKLRDLAKDLKTAIATCRKAKGDERAQCVRDIVSKLEDLKGKIDAAIAQIRAKCAGSTSGRCAKVEQIVDRLQKLKDRLDQLESKLQKGNG